MAQSRRNKPPISPTPLSETPLPGPGRLRPGRDYAREYATRKREARRKGFTSVRRERGAREDFRRLQTARGVAPRTIESQLRGGMARQAGVIRGSSRNANLTPLEKGERYNLDDFSRSYVMSHWQEFGWFDSWDEAREWYYATQ